MIVTQTENATQAEGQISAVTVITCGSFTFTRRLNDMLWLGNEEGEGMQVNEKDLELVLKSFWEKNF